MHPMSLDLQRGAFDLDVCDNACAKTIECQAHTRILWGTLGLAIAHLELFLQSEGVSGLGFRHITLGTSQLLTLSFICSPHRDPQGKVDVRL